MVEWNCSEPYSGLFGKVKRREVKRMLWDFVFVRGDNDEKVQRMLIHHDGLMWDIMNGEFVNVADHRYSLNKKSLTGVASQMAQHIRRAQHHSP